MAAMDVPADRVDIRVVLYQAEGHWVAQGIDFDTTAKSGTPTEASENFNASVGAEFVMSAELGDAFPLAGVEPAPKQFWDIATPQRCGSNPRTRRCV